MKLINIKTINIKNLIYGAQAVVQELDREDDPSDCVDMIEADLEVDGVEIHAEITLNWEPYDDSFSHAFGTHVDRGYQAEMTELKIMVNDSGDMLDLTPVLKVSE